MTTMTMTGKTKYRGFLPYATFGTGKKSHHLKIALGKLIAVMKQIANKIALAKNHSNKEYIKSHKPNIHRKF